jgi:branched-chain amino acid transport system permease protein
MLFFIQQIINGLGVGSIYALLAIGFTMIFGILRMMNFAHGDIYAFCAVFTASLLASDMPVVLAFPIGIATGAIIAIAIERICYRPLRTVDRTVALISSLGAAFILRSLSSYLWGVRHWPFPQVLGPASVTMGKMRIPTTDLSILAITLASIAVFNYFLRRARIGRGILLVAQDIPTASLMGVPINRTVVAVYAIGGAFGALGGILFASIYGVAFTAMGFSGTLKAFVAAIVGGIGNLTGALVAGLALGVIETLVVVYGIDWFGLPPGYRDGVSFVILIGFLLLKPTGLMGTRVSAGEMNAPRSLARSSAPPSFGEMHIPSWLLWSAALLAAVLFPLVVANPYVLRIANLIAIYSIAVLGLNLVQGYCGQFHFGQSGFLAIGAYTTALLMIEWQASFLVALPVSAAMAFAFGLLIGLPTLRVRGDYLALVTLAFGEMVRLILLNSDFSRGPMGIPGIPLPVIAGITISDNVGFFYVALVLLAVTLAFCFQVTRSFIGRAWIAIAEDEVAAGAMGINVFRYKILAFALASMVGGIAGSYMAVFTRYISPADFTIDQSVLMIVMLVIGGLGHLPSSVIGAAVMIVATELLRPIPEFRIAVIGIIMIAIPVLRPQGLFRDLIPALERRARQLGRADGLFRRAS